MLLLGAPFGLRNGGTNLLPCPRSTTYALPANANADPNVGAQALIGPGRLPAYEQQPTVWPVRGER